MPIHPDDRGRYPDDWTAISKRIREERAGGRCECTGQCGGEHEAGRCGAPNGAIVRRLDSAPELWRAVQDVPVDDSLFYRRPFVVILTVAHLDHTPENCDPANLLAMCQRCHLVYDKRQHAGSRVRRRDRAQVQLFEVADAV